MIGHDNCGNTYRLLVKSTIFGNAKAVLYGLGENLMGMTGWAHLSTFRGDRCVENALAAAKIRGVIWENDFRRSFKELNETRTSDELDN